MSTRVQKGGPIFRPVVKPRGRSSVGTSRQSSVAADPQSSVTPNGSIDALTPASMASTAMPPPAAIPSTVRSASHGPQPSRPSRPPSSSVPPSIQASTSANIQSARLPNPSSSQPTTHTVKAISTPTRNGPIPLTPSQSSSFPVAVSAASIPSAPQTINPAPPPASLEHSIIMGPPVVQYHGFNLNDVVSSSVLSDIPQESGGIGLPRLAINTDSVVKAPQPRRKSGRKKNASVEVGEPQFEGDEAGAQHKTRNGTRSRKPRSHFDPDAGPGEELDPTAVTMATLCSDTGQGRISSKAVQIQNNHAAWKASNREKRARMKMLMESKKYGKKEGAEGVVTGGQIGDADASPVENPVPGNAIPGPSNQLASASVRAPSTGPPPEDETGQGFDYSQTMSTSRFNVQVRIGPNGETIIDEESLFVDRVDENEAVNYTHVEESDTTKFVNSSTYGKKYRGSRWSAEETELFFDALSQFGENYELISYVLPGRDRKACKNKFKAEDRKNPNRITYCLNNRIPYDMQTLSRMTGKDFTGPTPEILAPVVLSLAEPDKTGDEPPESARKKSTTPGMASDGAEVLGDAASFDRPDDG